MNSSFKHRHHHISFKSAVSGLFLAIKTEINMKIIITAAIAAIFLGIVFNIFYEEWLVLILTIFIVFMAEMVNTSIEAVCDLVTTEWKEEVKVAKDVASGMVLLSCAFALIIGLLIFLPKIWLNY